MTFYNQLNFLTIQDIDLNIFRQCKYSNLVVIHTYQSSSQFQPKIKLLKYVSIGN